MGVLVLLVFLPPLLYSSAFFVDLRALREDARVISLSAIGLVLATTAAVGSVAASWSVSPTGHLRPPWSPPLRRRPTPSIRSGATLPSRRGLSSPPATAT